MENLVKLNIIRPIPKFITVGDAKEMLCEIKKYVSGITYVILHFDNINSYLLNKFSPNVYEKIIRKIILIKSMQDSQKLL